MKKVDETSIFFENAPSLENILDPPVSDPKIVSLTFHFLHGSVSGVSGDRVQYLGQLDVQFVKT